MSRFQFFGIQGDLNQINLDMPLGWVAKPTGETENNELYQWGRRGTWPETEAGQHWFNSGCWQPRDPKVRSLRSDPSTCLSAYVEICLTMGHVDLDNISKFSTWNFAREGENGKGQPHRTWLMMVWVVHLVWWVKPFYSINWSGFPVIDKGWCWGPQGNGLKNITVWIYVGTRERHFVRIMMM